jgi:hypothetical protein
MSIEYGALTPRIETASRNPTGRVAVENGAAYRERPPETRGSSSGRGTRPRIETASRSRYARWRSLLDLQD